MRFFGGMRLGRVVRGVLAAVGCSALLFGAGCDRGASSDGKAASQKTTPAASAKPTAKPTTPVADGAPNILFILVDTMRADRLGAYGNKNGLTPFMDAVANDGVVFERAIAPAPWTLPSVSSIFSGVYPSVHGANDYDAALDPTQQSVGVNVLADSYETLAEHLHDGGCETAGFVANIFLKPKFGLSQGFEHYDSSFVDNSTQAGVVNAAALKWLQTRDTSKPFFLYLHYMDVHAPYTSDDRFVQPQIERVEQIQHRHPVTEQEQKNHPGYFRKSAQPYLQNPQHKALFGVREYWQARYDAGVAQVDYYMRELAAQLDEMGLWQDLYVVIVADHGEALGEHGIWTHGLSAHQDQLHVPVILRWPGKLTAGRRIPQSVRLFDVMPTLVEQLGLPAPEGIQARSLVELIEGRSSESRGALGEAVKHNPGQLGYVRGPWKLFVDRTAGTVSLFNLDDDPGEIHDVAAQNGETLARLTNELSALVAENAKRAAGAGGAATPASAEELERLKALGYVGDDDGG